jgi:hypothetical protein
MKFRTWISRAVLMAVMALFFAWPAHAEGVPIAEYRQQLQDIAAKVDALQLHPETAGGLVASLPDQVVVTTGSGEISVNNKSLKDNLAAFAAAGEEKRPELLRQIQSYTQAMLDATASYEKQRADIGPIHSKLDQILARREFKKVQGPSAKDVLLARIYRWLSRLLGKLTFRPGGSFDLMRMLIYLLIGAAVVLLLWWTIRRLRRPQEDIPEREIIPFAPSARGWRTWLAEARALAQQQDWRNAIHLAYWAGISYLEEHGAWKPNRARTPREYLRLIGTRAAQYPVLAALTRKLEVVWYGYGNAAEADFEEALGQLEKLGCR